MITAFPPDILVCTDERYSRMQAFLSEDALQLKVDQLAEENPAAGWQSHDIAQDATVRARLLRSEEGRSAIYVSRSAPKQYFRIGQIDRRGAADVLSLSLQEPDPIA